MNAAVRDGEESYFVFGDYIEESMQGGSALARSVLKGEENLLTSQVIRQVKAKKENVDVILADCDPVIGACRMGRMRKNGKEADNK